MSELESRIDVHLGEIVLNLQKQLTTYKAALEEIEKGASQPLTDEYPHALLR